MFFFSFSFLCTDFFLFIDYLHDTTTNDYDHNRNGGSNSTGTGNGTSTSNGARDTMSLEPQVCFYSLFLFFVLTFFIHRLSMCTPPLTTTTTTEMVAATAPALVMALAPAMGLEMQCVSSPRYVFFKFFLKNSTNDFL